MHVVKHYFIIITEMSKWGTIECECLEAHNQYRALHGAPPLKLNAKLCRAAEAAAADYGENIYCCTDCKKVTGSAAAKAWYNEIELYDFEKSEFSIETGHFTQLVWKDSANLGVGYKKVGKKFYIVCHYKPSGNIKGRYKTMVLPKTQAEE
uniref:SCP domain-containing protein n=1 Tax=Glossina brevipalpis TaxID=37001 RepID=A0A1A9WEZ7_9MUSC